MVRMRRRFWKRPGRCGSWWNNFRNDFVIGEEWKENVRMSEENFNKLCDQVRPFVEKKLQLHCSYYLADEGRYRKGANAFEISRSSVSLIVRKVSFIITYHLGPKYVKLPGSEDEMKSSV